MKRYYAAAGALLLGTSALAWAGDTDKLAVEPTKVTTESKTVWDKTAMALASDTSWDKTSLATKSETATTSDSKLDFASLDADLAPLAAMETHNKAHLAATQAFADSKAMTDGKVQMAAMDSKVDTAWTETGKVEMASTETKVDTAWSDTVKVQTAATDVDAKVGTGMGGPLEDETTATSAVVQPSNANPELDARGIPVISDPAFVPSGFNGLGGAVGGPVEGGDDESYPACTREVTDNCIQLYERGVSRSQAKVSTGKVETSGTTKVEHDSMTNAVGGPYEPVESDGSELAMNGDGRIDVMNGEIDDGDVQTVAVPTEKMVASHSDYQGVGGPVEAQSGYPPCSPGPGDDRCIQLYEAGVTGAGN